MLPEQIKSINEAVKKRVIKEVKDLFPVVGKLQRIELKSINIDEAREPDNLDFSVLKDLKLKGKTLEAPVKV